MAWAKELQIAKCAAIAAGQYLCTIDNPSKKQKKTVPRDVKLKADLKSEAIIINALSTTCQYSILAEESGQTGGISDLEPMWIVDPLDGTVNYSRGIGICCISIALYKKFTPLLGVIYDFKNNELFSGIVAEGAELNGRKIEPSGVETPQEAILTTGFPASRDFKSAPLQSFLTWVQNFKKLRLLGSAALSLAYVACGRVDAYLEEDIMFWDVAAGLAIAQAAGAFISINETGSRPWAVLARAAGKKALWD